MPRTTNPKYRLHKATGQALVQINGKRHYLGKHGTKASRELYHRLVAEALAAGPLAPAPSVGAIELTIGELLAAYWLHAESYFRTADGCASSELECIRCALKPLRRLYESLPARDFGPLKLQTVQRELIDAGLSRGVVNANVRRIKRVFRWGVANEILAADAHHALAAVDGLKRGRSAARETEPIKPVPQALVDAVLALVPPQVAALIRLQLLTGARPTELLTIRGCDLDTTGRVWAYRPESHKTAHHGHQREIYLGPKAQAVLGPWLKLDTQAYLFSPRDAEAARNEQRKADRKTPRWASHSKRTPVASRKRPPRERYDVCSYRRAIHRACDVADAEAHTRDKSVPPGERIIPRWSPHRLRHNAATHLRKQYGVELARIVLGHSALDATEIYAEADRTKAVDCMARIG